MDVACHGFSDAAILNGGLNKWREETRAYLPPDELASALGTLGLDPDDPVITYCNAGNTASAIAFAMALMRHQRVSIYDGSLRDWAADPTLPMNSPATD